MNADLDFAPELFGLWSTAPVYGGPEAQGDETEALEAMSWRVVLDTKAEAAGSPLDDLQDMLNGMTKELRQQMQQFQALRRDAEARALVPGEEIDRKTVQADAKASIEAMSVIVRTLEKIDSLQRTIAHDRQLQAERDFDAAGHAALVADYNARIERRALELLQKRDAELAQSAAFGRVDAEAGDPPDMRTGPPRQASDGDVLAEGGDGLGAT